MGPYEYVGPKALLADVEAGIARFHLAMGARGRDLLTRLRLPAQSETVLTYIVDETGALWVADRHSEHVACARGDPVLAAGEMTVDLSDGEIAVISATNQSTGYCPDPGCWSHLAEALDAVGVERPDGFESEFEFGRCESCAAIAIVKDGDRICVECGGALAALRA